MKWFKSHNVNDTLYSISALIFKLYLFAIGNILLFSYKDQVVLQLIGFHQKEALRFGDFNCLDNYQRAFIVDVLVVRENDGQCGA